MQTIRSILIARGAFADIYEPAWVKALNDLGVQTSLFDSHSFTLPGLLGRIERRLLLGPGIRRLQQQLLRQVKQQRPDCLLLFQGHYFSREIIQELKSFTFVTGYHNDDPFGSSRHLLRYRHLLPALPHYHGYHFYRAINVEEARSLGQMQASLVLPAYIPWLDYPRTLDHEQQKQWGCDLIFAGHWENDHRVACLTALAKQNINLRLYGGERYWRRHLPSAIYRQLGPARHLPGEAYRLALSAAKIGLCFVSKRNRDQYTRRTFEIPACGLFLLAERTPWMEGAFQEGKEAEFFAGPDELVEKVTFYLHNETARQRIAAAGRDRVILDGHDLYSRMREWLNEVNAWRSALL
ncbi:CgeB family protein [Candidatus Magnetaquicoccus inordinatus]|uniref:CgeB family protein n=1 Tax=Candidatus Magnetaquicoccus inordinatus TaxID=2496818 RepID=UPI00187D445C|nr:glycosyltransferase [Candidatus Magnetaquicoccus inordinatus]